MIIHSSYVKERRRTSHHAIRRIEREWNDMFSIVLDNFVKSILSRIMMEQFDAYVRFKGIDEHYEMKTKSGKTEIGY